MTRHLWRDPHIGHTSSARITQKYTLTHVLVFSEVFMFNVPINVKIIVYVIINTNLLHNEVIY